MSDSGTNAIGGFFVRHTGTEWVVWGPMGPLSAPFVGKYSGHSTAESAYAYLRVRRTERIAYEGKGS